MNKKLYNEPRMEIVEIEVEDVICMSGGDNDTNWWDGKSKSATDIEQ